MTKCIFITGGADHPWFITCQFNPEFKSKPDKPHPLFREFIKASMEHSAR